MSLQSGGDPTSLLVASTCWVITWNTAVVQEKSNPCFRHPLKAITLTPEVRWAKGKVTLLHEELIIQATLHSFGGKRIEEVELDILTLAGEM